MAKELLSTIESMFTGLEGGVQLKEKLETVDGLLTGFSITDTLNQHKLFLEAIEIVLNFGTKTIADKLLITPNDADDKAPSYDFKLILDCLAKISSIVQKSISIYCSLQSFKLEYISQVFGPPIIKLDLIFQDNHVLPDGDDSVVSLTTSFLTVMQKSTLKMYLDTMNNPLYVKILKLFVTDLVRFVLCITVVLC